MSALVLMATVLLSRMAISRAWNDLTAFWQFDLSGLSGASWTEGSAIAQMRMDLLDIAKICAPWMLVPLLVGVAAYYAQVGFLFAPKLLLPKASRINPLSGFKRMFGTHGVTQGASSLFKLGVAALLLYQAITGTASSMTDLSALPVTADAGAIGRMVFSVLARIVVVFGVIGALDFMYQRSSYERKIRMTKQEVKEDFKQSEGDPVIRQRIRRRGRQIAQRRMMERVKKADVVVANPTHVSIALIYELGTPAPVVVAKGRDELALRIRDVAAKHDVPVVENRPLAWDLYQTCDLDDPVPARLFSVVAQLLAEVYRIKGKRVRP